MNLFDHLDWISIKLTLGSILLSIIGSGVVQLLAGMAAVSTIIYNVIKTYKEIKDKK